jgi:hypothetical protein
MFVGLRQVDLAQEVRAAPTEYNLALRLRADPPVLSWNGTYIFEWWLSPKTIDGNNAFARAHIATTTGFRGIFCRLCFASLLLSPR